MFGPQAVFHIVKIVITFTFTFSNQKSGCLRQAICFQLHLMYPTKYKRKKVTSLETT